MARGSSREAGRALKRPVLRVTPFHTMAEAMACYTAFALSPSALCPLPYSLLPTPYCLPATQ